MAVSLKEAQVRSGLKTNDEWEPSSSEESCPVQLWPRERENLGIWLMKIVPFVKKEKRGKNISEVFLRPLDVIINVGWFEVEPDCNYAK